MDVLIITWPGHNYARNSLRGLIAWHESKGHKCRFSNFRVANKRAHYGHPDIVYIWNGEYNETRGVIDYVRSHAGMIKYVELGWFPQNRFLYFDDHGTNANCSLFVDPLDWVQDDPKSIIDRHRESYYEGKTWTGSEGSAVLVPLQVSSDTQLVRFGNGWNNQTLIDYASHKYDKIILRPHPKDGNINRYRIPLNAKIESNTDINLIDAILKSSKVVGINSTVLLESALIGAPVEFLGKSFLSHKAGQDKILSALIQRQIPMGESNLDHWNKPHLGLLHSGLSPRPHWHYPDHPVQEFEDLCQVVRDLQPKNLLYIGAGAGKTLLRLAESALPSLKQIALVDLPGSVWGEQGSEHHLARVITQLQSRGLDVTTMLADSRDKCTLDFLNDHSPYSIIVLDGDVTYEGLVADFSNTWSQLDVDGICVLFGIFVNDTLSERFPDPTGRHRESDVSVGIPRFWNEISQLESYRILATPQSQNGIGILFKKV